MGFWIREPTGAGHIPGTVKLYENDIAPGEAIEEIGRVSLGLQNQKRDSAAGVVLVPQPSDSPNDPLVCLQPSTYSVPSIDDLLLKELAPMEERLDTFRNLSWDYSWYGV